MKEKSRMRAERGDVELVPDAWERFERAVDVLAKSPPQHKRATATAKATKMQSEMKVGAKPKAKAPKKTPRQSD
jgi:hypothetical protein